MLPERLSTDLTSLNAGRGPAGDRRRDDGGRRRHRRATRTSIARSRPQPGEARLRRVAAWLDGQRAAPPALAAAPGVDAQLRLQDARRAGAAGASGTSTGRSTSRRSRRGRSSTATRSPTCAPDEQNRAKELIEDFMIAANGVTARFLEAKGFPSLRRVVRSPERWDASSRSPPSSASSCPPSPTRARSQDVPREAPRGRPAALPRPLARRRQAARRRASTSSSCRAARADGHFGLAVQRLHALDGAEPPLPRPRHAAAAQGRARRRAVALPGGRARRRWRRHCTEQEDTPRRSSARCASPRRRCCSQSRVGERFDAIVTGASRRRAPGCASSSRRSRAGSSRVPTASTSATRCA